MSGTVIELELKELRNDMKEVTAEIKLAVQKWENGATDAIKAYWVAEKQRLVFKQYELKIDMIATEIRTAVQKWENAVTEKAERIAKSEWDRLVAEKNKLENALLEERKLSRQQLIINSNNNNNINSELSILTAEVKSMNAAQQEITADLREIKLHLPTQAISPPHTPAVVAEHTIRRLNGDKSYIKFSPAADTNSDNSPAVLTIAEQNDIINQSKNETILVAQFTHYLIPILNNEYRLLVNSETKPWLEILPGYDKSKNKPDLWIGPYYAVQSLPAPKYNSLTINSAITKLENEFKINYIYGEPCYSGSKRDLWYDSIMPIAAKIKFSNEALGEAINYTYWFSQSKDHPSTRGMLITDEKFYLLETVAGVTVKITVGQWIDFGSAKLIQNHFSIDSPWTKAIRELCIKMEVTPIRFLGAGSTGRVIEVIKTAVPGARGGNTEQSFALKVVLSDNVRSLTLEHMFMQTIIKGNELTEIVPDSISEIYYLESDASETEAAAFLLGPVGQAIDVDSVLNNKEFESIFEMLRRLHSRNILHGDPRLPNILRKPNRVNNISTSSKSEFSPYSIYLSRSSSSHCNQDKRIPPPVPQLLNVQSAPSLSSSEFFFVDFMDIRNYQSTTINPRSFDGDLYLFIGYFVSQDRELLEKNSNFTNLITNYYEAIRDDFLFKDLVKNTIEFIVTIRKKVSSY